MRCQERCGGPARSRARPPRAVRRGAIGLGALLVLALPAAAAAEVVFDGTLGSRLDGTPLQPGDTPPLSAGFYQISDNFGAFAGDGGNAYRNLFFSFDRFGIGAAETALFFSMSGHVPESVIARVTGGVPSEILGTLRSAFTGADVFLLNPDGVFLGPDARVIASGDVYLSSADRLDFGPAGGEFFDAHAGSTVLSAAPPTDFGFLVEAPAPVGVYGSQLALTGGTGFSLVGGDVEIVGRGTPGSVTVGAVSGRVQLAAVHGDPQAEVRVPLDLTGFDPSGFGPGELGDVRLGSSALRGTAGAPSFLSSVPDAPAVLDVSSSASNGTGGVVIRAGRFVMTGGEVRGTANNFSAAGVREANLLDAAAAERVRLEAGASVAATTGTSALSGAGDVRLDAPIIEITGDGTQVVSQTQGSQPGGAIGLSARDEIAVTDLGQVFSQATGSASAPGGDIDVVVSDGRLRVQSRDTDGGLVSQISALTSSSVSSGGGGSLSVRAGSVELRDGGQLRTTTLGAADAGTLSIQDTGTLQVSGTAMVDTGGTPDRVAAGLFALTQGAGAGGLVDIDVQQVEVTDGGRISASSQGSGPSGQIELDAADSVLVQGSAAGFSLVSTETAAGGPGGNLQVTTGRLELRDGGQLSATTTGTEDAGNVIVSADRVEVTGVQPGAGGANPSGIFAKSAGGGADAGDAGSIFVTATRDVLVADGARISVSSIEGGDAGDIQIDAGRRFAAVRDGRLETSSLAASGGRITLAASQWIYLSDSRIETNVLQGGEDGGDVAIPLPPVELGVDTAGRAKFVVLNRSEIVASAQDGNAGNIGIGTRRGFFPSDQLVMAEELARPGDSVLDATSETGLAGEVRVVSPSAEFAGQIVPLPVRYFDASQLLRTPCEARRARTGSLVVETGGALESPPDGPLSRAAEPGAGQDASRCPTM